MEISIKKHHIAYALHPFRRNQDVIKIHEFSNGDFCIAVVDGWNNPKYLSDISGQKVAQLVANEFPKLFFEYKKEACVEMDKRVRAKYPEYASCVASFLFHWKETEIIISVGDVQTILFQKSRWDKPKQIGDHQLDPKKYPSNVSHFFGRGELRDDSMYSSEPDILEIRSGTPVIFATDGIKDVLSIAEINRIVGNPDKKSPVKIIEKLVKEIQKRKTQKDDISLLVRL